LENQAAKPRRLTQHSANDTHPRWSTDSISIYFLSTRTGSQQIWRLPLTGGEGVQVTDYALDVNSFRFSSGGGRIALSMEVFRDCDDLKCSKDRLDAVSKSKPSGRVFDNLFVRHWDTWSNGTRSNLFVAPVNPDGRAGTPVNVSKALDADVPSKPDGGDEEYVFSPDGSNVVFSRNVVRDNAGPGIVVMDATGTTISQNSFSNNGSISIDLDPRNLDPNGMTTAQGVTIFAWPRITSTPRPV